jgi:hypothetical protein
MVPTDLITPGMERCAEACAECHRACLRAAMTDGIFAERARLAPEHFRLLIDCAELCAATGDFMLRGSAFHERVSGVCAEICTACAQSCSQFERSDDGTGSARACRQACERCAESCREVSVAIR